MLFSGGFVHTPLPWQPEDSSKRDWMQALGKIIVTYLQISKP